MIKPTPDNPEKWIKEMSALNGVFRQPIQFMRESDLRGRFIRIPVNFRFTIGTAKAWLTRRYLMIEFLPPPNAAADTFYRTTAAIVVGGDSRTQDEISEEVYRDTVSEDVNDFEDRLRKVMREGGYSQDNIDEILAKLPDRT